MPKLSKRVSKKFGHPKVFVLAVIGHIVFPKCIISISASEHPRHLNLGLKEPQWPSLYTLVM